MFTECIKSDVINVFSPSDMKISFYLDLTCFLFISIYSLCHISHSLRFGVRKLLLDTFPSVQESAVEVLHYILPMSQS